MEAKLLASIQASKMLGAFSSEFLVNDLQKFSDIPLTHLGNKKNKYKDWINEEKQLLVKQQAANMLGGLLQNDAQKSAYIPLINLRNESMKCKNCVRETKGSTKNLNFLFDFDKHIESGSCSISPTISVSSSDKKLTRSLSLTRIYPTSEFLYLQSPDYEKATVKEWTFDEYQCTKKDIFSSIKFSCRRSLIIWCPTNDVEIELIHAWIVKSERKVYFHDRWIGINETYCKNTWGGVVAVYPDRKAAKAAAKMIPLHHVSLKVIKFPELLHCFVKAELKYFSEEKTQILIHSKIFRRENIENIKVIVHKFGQVEFCGYDYVVRNATVVFYVTYTFATHAFLAKTVLDDLPFDSNLLDVEIKMTPKIEAIFGEFRFQLKKVIGNAYFPF